MVNYNLISRSPLIKLLNPLENFTRTGPVLWIFLFAGMIFGIGLILPVRLFVWIGGFLVLLFAAVAIAIFEAL